MKATILALVMTMPALAHADDAPVGLSGGAARPLGAADTAIRMDTETVIVAMTGGNYVVDAAFEFFNAGPSTTVAVGFPVDPPEPGRQGSLSAFESWVDGRAVPVREVPDADRKGDGWMVKDVSFPAKKTTRVRVRYVGGWPVWGDDFWRRFSYRYGTGAGWSGNIGRALFVFRADPSFRFKGGSPGAGVPFQAFRAADGVYAYLLKDLKPEPDARISASAGLLPWESDSLLDHCLDTACMQEIDPDYAKWRFVRESIRDKDLTDLTVEQLRRFRNAFFAGHGRIFKDSELRAYFGKYSWYKPRSDFKESDLNPVEIANVRRIAADEEALKKKLADPAAASVLDGYTDLRAIEDVFKNAPPAQPRPSGRR